MGGGSGWRGVCVYVNMLHLSKELYLEVIEFSQSSLDLV